MLRPTAYPPLATSPEPRAVAGTRTGFPKYDLEYDAMDDDDDDHHHHANPPLEMCPTCLRPWTYDSDPPQPQPTRSSASAYYFQPPFTAPNYFRLLEASPRVDDSTSLSTRTSPEPLEMLGGGSRISSLDEEGHSLPTSRPSSRPESPANIDASSTAPGYYSRFFTQIKKLGRGARGQVYLCQHVLNGNKLGVYAVKKMPCGDDQQVLLDSLKEVLMMETLQHPNIIHYQHAWIENARASKFSPSVPTLFILMAAANGGSLEDWITTRSGHAVDSGSGSWTPQATSNNEPNRADKLKAAFRLRKAAHQQHHEQQTGVAVHLLREDEVLSLARDIVAGLGFLHSKGVLHQDVKPANCLLHWSEDALIPRVLLSDFGSSSLLHDNWRRQRSGHTGTMEFMAPEAVRVNARTGMLQELSSKADIWSFGMILHLMIFLQLPYSQVDDVDALRDEMLAYGGWQDEAASMLSNIHTCQSFIPLLSKLLQLDPMIRPSAEEILDDLRQVASDRNLPFTDYETNETDRARGYAKKEARLRRRRRQSTSNDQEYRPRLLSQGSLDLDHEEDLGEPLWMASSLAAQHPLVRYQQEHSMNVPPSPSSWYHHLYSMWVRCVWLVNQHTVSILAIVWAAGARMLYDQRCYPGHLSSVWDYVLWMLSLLTCMLIATTEQGQGTSRTTLLPLGLLLLSPILGFVLGMDVCSI